MGKLGNSDITFHLTGDAAGKAQFRAKGIVVTGEAQRFPAIGCLVSATEVILVGDFWVVLE